MPRFERHGVFEPGRRMPFGPGHVMLFGPARMLGGLACLALPLLLLGLGFVFWHRRQRNRRTAGCPQPPASAAQPGQ
jgi:uncharacterized iron-regulated membrane protein